MYLGFLIFACSTLCLVHVNEALVCEICLARGEDKLDATQACDLKKENETCTAADPVCMAEHDFMSGVFYDITKRCASRNEFNELKLKMDNSPPFDDLVYAVAMCEESGCTAEFPKPVERCPTCKSTTSLEDCDQNREMRRCYGFAGTRNVCAVYEFQGSGYFRGCLGENYYKRLMGTQNLLEFGSCKEDECMASFRGVRQCPTCDGKTLEECDQNIVSKECDKSPQYKLCILEKRKAGNYRRSCISADTLFIYEADWSGTEKVAYCGEDDCIATFAPW